MKYIVFFIIVLFILDHFNLLWLADIIIGLIGLYILFRIFMYIRTLKKRKQMQKEWQDAIAFYYKQTEKIIPKKDPLSIYIEDFSNDQEFTFIPGWNNIWIERKTLYIYPYPPEIENYTFYKDRLRIIKLPIKNIRYYTIDEEETIENEITGGEVEVSSNASSTTTTFNNKVKAKVNPIHAKMIKKNNKLLCLFYQNNNKQNNVLILNDKSYYTLFDLIPEKSMEIVNEIKKEQIKRKTRKKKET